MIDGVIVERLPVNRLLRRRVKLWFGMYVWQSIAETKDLPYEDLGTVGNEDLICQAMYYAIEYGAFKDRKPWRRMSISTVRRSYELMPQKQLQRIVDCLVKSKVGGETILNLLSDDKKKPAQEK